MTFRKHFISETPDIFKLFNPEYALYPFLPVLTLDELFAILTFCLGLVDNTGIALNAARRLSGLKKRKGHTVG